MLFEEWQFEYFGLHSGTFSLASLIKAYRRRALSDHPDKGGQTGVFQETKNRYDELTRRLEYFSSIQGKSPHVTISHATQPTTRHAKKPRQEPKPKYTLAPPWHAQAILEEQFSNIQEALDWIPIHILRESKSGMITKLQSLEIGQTYTVQLRCVEPPADTVEVKYHGTSWMGLKKIL